MSSEIYHEVPQLALPLPHESFWALSWNVVSEAACLLALREEEPQISQIPQIGTGVLSEGSAFVLELESRLGLTTEHAIETQLDLEGLLRHRLEVTGQARCQSAAQVFNLRNLRSLFWPALAAVGLLMDFNVLHLKDGMQRFVN